MNVREPTRIKVIDLDHSFFTRELHELNAKILKQFNLKSLPHLEDMATFVYVAQKDETKFYFILAKNDDIIQEVQGLMTPRMLKKSSVHKGQCFGLWNKPTKDDDFDNVKGFIPLKIEMFDEAFFLYSTYDSSKVIY